MFYEELLYGPMSDYITNRDYNLINDSLYCLYGSCTIQFPEYKKGIDDLRVNNIDRYIFLEEEIPEEIM